MRAKYVVDWDGTCVEEMKPWVPGTSGPWLPGAIEGLKWLSGRGYTVIYSLRLHLYEIDDFIPRNKDELRAEYEDVRRRLDEAALYEIGIYPPNRGKPPGEFYIDDRGVHFGGSWDETKYEIQMREARCLTAS